MNKYKIILADPPWNISKFSRSVRPNQKNHPYSMMSLKDIKNLPVRKLADEDGCHLFLWTTHKYLPKAFEVMEAWGFKYHCTLTWNKSHGFTPFSFMWSTEFCLYGQLEGKWVKPKKFGIKTLITEKSTKHSKKPQEMYRLIKNYCGDLSKIELFARHRQEGWDIWGNEVISDIILLSEDNDVNTNYQKKLEVSN